MDNCKRLVQPSKYDNNKIKLNEKFSKIFENKNLIIKLLNKNIRVK